MKRIIIQIEPAELEELDRAAHQADRSRSAFVREAIEQVLMEWRRRSDINRVIESYRAHPQEEDLILSKKALRAVWPE